MSEAGSRRHAPSSGKVEGVSQPEAPRWFQKWRIRPQLTRVSGLFAELQDIAGYSGIFRDPSRVTSQSTSQTRTPLGPALLAADGGPSGPLRWFWPRNSVRLWRMKKKSVRKRTGHTRTVPMSGEVYQALLDQRQRFIDKFGREPGPNDPVFFDPDADTPQQITEEKLGRMMNEALSAAGIDPALVYAYNKTGLLVSEDNLHLLSDEDLAEWQQAVDEAEQMFRKNRA
jgi:hypothetical protein